MEILDRFQHQIMISRQLSCYLITILLIDKPRISRPNKSYKNENKG